MTRISRRTATALIGAAALVRPARAAATDLNFITDFGFNGRHAYFYVALQKGYYAAEGLNVTIQRGQGSADAIKKVASGAATIGFADAGSLVLARGNDGIPVKLGAVIYATPPHAIFALAGSGIKSPKDLEGRSVADTAFSAMPVIFGAYAKAAGIDKSKVTWTAAEGASLPSLLATGRVDAIGQFTVGEPLLQAATAPKTLVRLAYKDVGLDYYGNGIVAAEQTLTEKPDLVKRFIAATLKGMQDAFADPAAAGVIFNSYHKQVSAEIARDETALVKELAIIPGAKPGVIDPARIKSTVEVMASAYQLKTPVKPEDLFVPGLV